MPIVLKCGSLNLLEPSGPVQACNGIALPLLNKLGLVNECIITGENKRMFTGLFYCKPGVLPTLVFPKGVEFVLRIKT